MSSFHPQINLTSAFILFGVIQAFVLGILLLSKGRRSALTIAGWSLLVLSVIEGESFLSHSGFVINATWVINLSPPLVFLIGPLAWLLVRKLYGQQVDYLLIHFLPSIFFFGYSILFYVQPSSYKTYVVLRDVHHTITEKAIPLFDFDPFDIRGIVIIEGLAIHLLAYSAAAILLILSRRKGKVGVRVSPVQRQWSTCWAVCSFLGGMIFLSTGGVINGHVFYKPLLPAYVVDLYCVLLAYASTIFWLSKTLPVPGKPKYQKSALDLELVGTKLRLLNQIMSDQQPFKSPDFSLAQFATLANMSTHHVSQVLNSGGMQFTDFVHRYRIEEARRILNSPRGEGIKVENLAYELGYKSKSAFFASFRQLTQMTPSQFRQSLKSVPAG